MVAGKFAAGTDVPVERSRAEVEEVLQRYGAESFAYGWGRSGAVIQFAASGRHVRMVLPLPDPQAEEFAMRRVNQHAGGLVANTPEKAQQLWEQACRQRWRALVLAIKAKLEAVEVGISTFEQEFLAHVVLPSGDTVGDAVAPAVETAYRTGTLPELMPGVA